MAGLLLSAAALVWLAWAAWSLWRAGTPLRPGARPRVLVDEGPYRLTRHPMVLGHTGLLLGAAQALHMPALGALAGLYLLVMVRWVVPAEEARLAATFGGWWRDYAGSTRRWL